MRLVGNKYEVLLCQLVSCQKSYFKDAVIPISVS